MAPKAGNVKIHKVHAMPKAHEGTASSSVLIVDENSCDLALHSIALAERGWQVTACASYSDAIARLDSRNFDLVLVEQGGPKFKGRCVLEHASKRRFFTPVLILANWAEMAIYLDAMELGALDYLEKPADPSKLFSLIEACLQSAEMLSQEPEPGPLLSETARKVASIASLVALGFQA